MKAKDLHKGCRVIIQNKENERRRVYRPTIATVVSVYADWVAVEIPGTPFHWRCIEKSGILMSDMIFGEPVRLATERVIDFKKLL